MKEVPSHDSFTAYPQIFWEAACIEGDQPYR